MKCSGKTGGKLDRASKLPLYIQFKNAVIEKLKSGEMKPGSMMKTELELCEEYGISRFPVRQAMEELVAEGYLTRTRGKGTFVSKELPNLRSSDTKILGLILNHLTAGFNGEILTGFEKQARKRGYLTVACCSEGDSNEEMKCVDKLIKNGVSGIFIFPCDESKISSRLEELHTLGIYLGLIDRNPGIQDIDYIGSDNFGGIYSAVRHISMRGFRNTTFVTNRINISTVKERLNGYKKAVEDFDLKPAANIIIMDDNEKYIPGDNSRLVEGLKKDIKSLRNYWPLGIVALNDFIAIECMNVCIEEGLTIGRDVAVAGFDNIQEGSYQPVPLTTVAQNGLLLGSNAADVAIDKLEGKTNQVYKSIIPTQLVVRSSCGERL